jgi:hypothetical protein
VFGCALKRVEFTARLSRSYAQLWISNAQEDDIENADWVTARMHSDLIDGFSISMEEVLPNMRKLPIGRETISEQLNTFL